MADSAPPPNLRAPRKRLRTAAALFFSALMTSLAYFGVIVASLYWGFHTRTTPEDLWRALITLFAMGLGVMIALAWPFQALAFRLRWRRASTFLLAGMLVGVLLAAVALGYYLHSQDQHRVESAEVFGASIGFGVLITLPCIILFVVFWAIRRPDRDPAPVAASVFE